MTVISKIHGKCFTKNACESNATTREGVLKIVLRFYLL